MARIRGYKENYAKYLATPDYGTFEVHCLEISHPSFTTRFIQNRIPGEFLATDEQGNQRVYTPVAFEVAMPSVEAGTMQRLLCNIDAMNGDLYIALRAMPFDQRFQDPISVTHRIYFNNFTANPLISPPPVYSLHSAKPGAKVIRCEGRARGLGSRPAGDLYTIERFPVLGIRG